MSSSPFLPLYGYNDGNRIHLYAFVTTSYSFHISQSFNPLSIASVKSTFSPPEKMSSITRIWELFCFDLA